MSIDIFRMVNWEDKPAYGLGALALGVLLVWQSSRRTQPTPPGPRKFPVVGNMLSMPSKRQWEVFRDWKAVYGDLAYLEGFGQRILAVNSLPLAQKLLVNRAANYSDRGWTPLGDIIGFGWAFHMMNYSTLWRDHRRAFHQHLNQTQIHRYHPIIVQENARFMQRLLLKNVGFKEDMKLFFGALIMRVSYGRDDLEYNRQLIKEGQKFGEDWMEYSLPGRLLVGTFPSLQHSTFPLGSPGQVGSLSLRELTKSSRQDTAQRPTLELKARLVSAAFVSEGELGELSAIIEGGPSMASIMSLSTLLSALPNEDDPAYQYEDDVAKKCCCYLFLAGLILLSAPHMATHSRVGNAPRVQQRAQKELDDLSSWKLPLAQPFLPYGAPHVSTDDDVLDGYELPGGTMIIDEQTGPSCMTPEGV
ncbi:cytochrome P450 [Coprinopsis sp. MPI-PUGE-AT-0042]|nr:cytochrome P450 [Coprinopsis sp. MPI-PUGE-AT-0042]